MTSPNRAFQGPAAGAALAVLCWLLPSAFGGAAGSRIPAQGPEAEPPSIAVVDLLRVLDQYPAYQQARNDLELVKEQFALDIKKIEKQLDALQLDLKMLGEDEAAQNSTEARRLKLRMKALAQEGEDLAGFARNEVLRLQQVTEARMYVELNAVVRQFCRIRKIDLLLRKRPLRETSMVRLDLEQMSQRDVLFHSARLDVTEELMEYVKTAKPPAAAPAPASSGGENGGGDSREPAPAAARRRRRD